MACTYTLKSERCEDRVKLTHKHLAATPAKPLPTLVNLAAKFPPCYDQGDLGSCTANALVGVFQFDDRTFYGSRLFLYYNERKRDNNLKDDAGSTVSCGIVSLTMDGIAPEADWPYVTKKFNVCPPSTAYKDALKHKAIVSSHIAQDLQSLKTCLANGLPIAIGIMVYKSFESQQVTRNGIVPMPAPSEECLGGHAVVVVGYNDVTGRWILRNSWGTSWGDHGYFYLPYAYLLTSAHLASDFWVVGSVTSANGAKITAALKQA